VDKRLWINIGLLAFIVLLSLILLVPEKPSEEELQRVSTVDRKEILEIEVIRKELENFAFNKQGESWYMSTPLQFLANDGRVNAMLRMLNAESYSQLNPDEVDLEELGLKDPVVVMKLNEHEFAFGNTDAIDKRRYVLFDGVIHLTNDTLYQQLMTNAAFFANTKLLPVDFDINAIEFPENKMELVDGAWQLEPLMDIKPDQLKRLVFNWHNAIAISASKYQAPEKESFIKVSTTDGQQIIFVVVSTEPHLILGRKDMGVQLHMGSDEAEKLLLRENLNASNKLQEE
jgi:Domain of unknown function (DUF4340)